MQIYFDIFHFNTKYSVNCQWRKKAVHKLRSKLGNILECEFVICKYKFNMIMLLNYIGSA